MSYGALPPLSSVTYDAPPLPTSDTLGTPPVVTAPPTRVLQSLPDDGKFTFGAPSRRRVVQGGGKLEDLDKSPLAGVLSIND